MRQDGRTRGGSARLSFRAAGAVRAARRLLVVLAARLRGMPPADALLLLPETPDTAAVCGRWEPWSSALAHWGVREAPAATADLLVGRPSAVLAGGMRASWVLVPGTDRLRRLRRAGYSVVTYRVRWLTWQVVMASADGSAFGLARRTWAAGTRGDDGGRGNLARVLRPPAVTVASRNGRPDPGTLVAAGHAGRLFSLAVDIEKDRRRAVMLVRQQGDDRAQAVVKMHRGPGSEDRSSHEQRILAALPRSGMSPRPLGSGVTGAVRWSAETPLAGRPLHEVLTRPGEPVVEALEVLADWLGHLAASTRRTADWATAGTDDSVVALRGPAEELRPLLRGLAGVPSVLTHGDLASGRNVLVDASGRPCVLDWETARERGLPLLDLVPLLCWSLARAYGGQGPVKQAAYILDLAAGRVSHSDWLFDRVSRYAHRIELPPESVGRLALLAWGHQASMRLVHEELLRQEGSTVPPWTSVGELVLTRWQDEFGRDWWPRAASGN